MLQSGTCLQLREHRGGRFGLALAWSSPSSLIGSQMLVCAGARIDARAFLFSDAKVLRSKAAQSFPLIPCVCSVPQRLHAAFFTLLNSEIFWH